MKIIIFIISTILTVYTTNAARICDNYITDDWPNSRYNIVNNFGDNTVIDNKTNLMWKQCTEGLAGNDCMNGTTTLYNWLQALELPSVQNTTGFGGFHDWRLPNIEELRSIMTFNCHNPSINEVAFPNTPIALYWSSSPNAKEPAISWSIYTFGGHSPGNNRDANLHVRLVRTKQ